MKFAPSTVFELILEWAVIPTFDLVIEVDQQGFILVKRKLSPYKNTWALPGLRMYKGETIDETLARIAKDEIGIALNLKEKKLLGQYVGKFKSEHQRQDLSTGYYFRISNPKHIDINPEHFFTFQITKDIPSNMGAMYRYYLQKASRL